MNWPGKADCFKTIQAPSTATLRPCPEESVNFDTTENLIIEGDNLEVLKLLQKSYLGKVKMIYIDPPYNTGNDFIYPDNYSESLQTYLEYTGQTDAEGRKFGTNTESDGRFHSKWLNMMYPRLYLARNLLREDGVIFISIGETEQANLREACDSLFGEENLVGCVARVAKTTSNKGTHFAPSKDYVLVYAKSLVNTPELMEVMGDEYAAKFDEKDSRGHFATVGLYQAALDSRPNQRYWIECPDGSLAIPPGDSFPAELKDGAFIRPATAADKVWRWSYESYFAKKELIVFKQTAKSPLLKPDGTRSPWNVYTKYYLEDRMADGLRPRDFLDGITNDQGTAELKHLGMDDIFAFAKPSALISKMCSWLSMKDAVVLDFFAGSGTTAHAVLELNKQDGGNRKFILVQLPEPTDQKGYSTIAEITKERVRRVVKKLKGEEAGTLSGASDSAAGRGFRVFKLSESNFTSWDADAPKDAAKLATQMELHVDHVREGRTEQDLLYEVLLKSGYPLTVQIETLSLHGKTVYSVAGGVLLACFDKALTLEAVRAMGERKPERVVCLDAAFKDNDQLKTNAAQIFKTKGVASFKTV